MRLVVIESPFAGKTKADTDYNIEYLRACLHDSLMRGEAPFASHAIYMQPGVLDDKIPEQRMHGIEAGFAWREAADATIVYEDLGISKGMQLGIEAAERLTQIRIGEQERHVIEYRKLGGKWAQPRDTITEQTRSWWHGCWLDSGHHLFTRNGKSVYDALPFNEARLDSGYAPRKVDATYKIDYAIRWDRENKRRLDYVSEELPQGQFLRHVIDGFTILSWWDRTQGDTRGGCNSCYVVEGEHTSEQMLKWFPKHFPKQAAQLEAAGIRLVEVFVDA